MRRRMQNYVDVGASSGVRGGGRGADIGISHINHSALWDGRRQVYCFWPDVCVVQHHGLGRGDQAPVLKNEDP